MANVRISELPAATLPLTGAELVPVVQSGVTKQTTLANAPFIPAGVSAVPRTAQSKMRELISRADTGGQEKSLITFQAGGNNSDTVVVNSSINSAKLNLSSATIGGGGSLYDENYIGFGKNRSTFSTVGTAFTWPHLPTNNDLANLRVIKLSAFNVQTTLTSPSGYTATINGSQVDITISVALAAGERLIVEDRAAKVEDTGTPPSYSWIGGGYDNIVLTGVMQQITGAHHRILGGDHGSIFGGSYSIIGGGSYGFIGGGTNNELASTAGVGSVVIGGYRNLASGATSSILGGQENKASGAQAVILGGTRNSASATASVAGGRENSVSGSDSVVFGRSNTSSGAYSSVCGYQNTVSHDHAHIRGGFKGVTSYQGQDVRFAYRDTAVATSPYRQHFYVDLSKYTTGTTAENLETLNGVSGFAPASGVIWNCLLRVTARSGALRGGVWEVRFGIQNVSGTVSIIGGSATVTVIGVDANLGTGGDVATVSVSVVSNLVNFVVQPRIDTAVATKWGAVLDVVEVG